MRLIGRAFLFLLGLLLAIPVGLLALAIGIAVEPAAQDLIVGLGIAGFKAFLSDLSGEGVQETVPGEAFLRIWALSAAVLVLPPAFVALVGEIAGIRTFLWYGFGCGALTAALPWIGRGGAPLPDGDMLGPEGRITALLFITGAVAGLTYWLVAGRSAGPGPSRGTSAEPA